MYLNEKDEKDERERRDKIASEIAVEFHIKKSRLLSTYGLYRLVESYWYHLRALHRELEDLGKTKKRYEKELKEHEQGIAKTQTELGSLKEVILKLLKS